MFSLRTSLGALALAATLAGCEPPSEQMARGDTFYDGCRNCHGEQGEGDPRYGAPPIAGLDAWYVEAQLKKFRAGLRGYHPDDAAGLRMRPMSLFLPTDKDVAAVAAYVAQLPTPPKSQPSAAFATSASAERGKATFTTCTACHGPEGAGNQALGAPAIAGQPDWYLYEQIMKFKNGARGTMPQDVQGQTMRAIATTLTDEQAVKDVVAYTASLPYPQKTAGAK